MSYCRMGVEGSEVYAWKDVSGVWGIWHEGKSSSVNSLEKFKDFMLELRSRSIKIPDFVFEEIEWELAHPGEER